MKRISKLFLHAEGKSYLKFPGSPNKVSPLLSGELVGVCVTLRGGGGCQVI